MQPGRRVSNDLRVGRKMATFQLFLQSVGLRTYQHSCNRTTHIMLLCAPSQIARLVVFVMVASLKVTEYEYSRFPKTESLIKHSSSAGMSRNIADALYQ